MYLNIFNKSNDWYNFKKYRINNINVKIMQKKYPEENKFINLTSA